MEEDGETLPINSNLSCKLCGENQFEERDGFYYCLECGTKQDQIRRVEVEYDDNKKAKTQAIQAVKVEKPKLTSWECYNYILRGYVEELLSFGAKDELKLMTLQVWAAYLRRMEVAFFNRKQPDLPKLSIIYLQNDAETIYNHHKEARKKRKSKRGEGDSSCTSNESMSAKDYRKSKRKLDESIYSIKSSSGASGFTSSTSANSNKAIKLDFNKISRKYFKKKMPIKHLKKHEIDAEGLLECHKQPKTREVNRSDYSMMVVSTKEIYSILAIALNLIDDEIQICDLLRFVHEGHIGPNNVLQYFPENIVNNGKALLRNINYYKNPDKYSDKGVVTASALNLELDTELRAFLELCGITTYVDSQAVIVAFKSGYAKSNCAIREHISMLCRNIGIHKLKAPDIIKLVRRYVNELSLPSEINTYIERLINILPPQFGTRSVGVYPHYEARAMAYIIFVLKLLFGLDGDKEQRMSQASKKLNRKIEKLNCKSNDEQQLLFVWTEWVQYVEMRKIIVSHFNPAFCEQFKQCQSTTQLLEQMGEEIRRQDDQDNVLNNPVENHKAKQRLENFKVLFQRFQENYKNTQAEENKPMQYIEFKPSFTPGLSYFKSICLHCDDENVLNSDTYIKIPDFMRINHTERDVKSYLEVKPLIGYFQRHQKELKAYVLPSNRNRSYVGVFRAPRALFRGIEHLITRTQKASFNISEEEWAQNVAQEVVYNTNDLEFKTDLDSYEKRYFKKCRKMSKKLYDASMNYDLSILHNNEENATYSSVDEATSKQVFNVSDVTDRHITFDLNNEKNMNLKRTDDFITCPRRDLDQTNIFDGISDEESVLNEVEDINEPSGVTLLNCPDADTLSVGYEPSSSQERIPYSDEEFLDINSDICIKKEYGEDDCRKNSSRRNNKIPKDKTCKLYVSNMDCWMLLGNMLMLSKGQKSQLQDKFPRSFSWLLETCAQTLNVEWSAVYEQLLAIELMFCIGIEDPDKIKNCVYMNSYNPVKDFQMLLNSCREIW